MGATMDLKQCDRLIHRLIYPGYCNCNVINKIGLVTSRTIHWQLCLCVCGVISLFFSSSSPSLFSVVGQR